MWLPLINRMHCGAMRALSGVEQYANENASHAAGQEEEVELRTSLHNCYSHV